MTGVKSHQLPIRDRCSARALHAVLVSIALSLLPAVSHAQLDKLLDAAGDALRSQPGGAASGLSDAQVSGGLKEALANGVESAVNSLGRRDGFLGNSAVRIPLPRSLRKVEKGLRLLGKQQYADEFVTTMNRAAEAAVPEASAILGDAIRAMTFADARSILSGPDDAATQYFRKVGEKRLFDRMLPIVGDATDRAGVTSSYKQMLGKAGPAAKLVGGDAADVDSYITKKSLDGLFAMIAREEAAIRGNPAKRGTDLLRKVFGG